MMLISKLFEEDINCRHHDHTGIMIDGIVQDLYTVYTCKLTPTFRRNVLHSTSW